MKKIIIDKLEKHVDLVDRIDVESIISAAKMIIACLKRGNKILICGNGGSAADAQHIAAELVGKYGKMRKALPAIALNTNTSIITAIGNDYGFDKVFSRQIEALGQKGDILLAISTSGSSKNILKAIKTARNKGQKVILLTGEKGKRMKHNVDIVLSVPSGDTPLIQEIHILIGHTICQLVEKEY